MIRNIFRHHIYEQYLSLGGYEPRECPAQTKELVIVPYSINNTPVLIKINYANSLHGSDYSYLYNSNVGPGAVDFSILDQEGITPGQRGSTTPSTMAPKSPQNRRKGCG